MKVAQEDEKDKRVADKFSALDSDFHDFGTERPPVTVFEMLYFFHTLIDAKVNIRPSRGKKDFYSSAISFKPNLGD